ncbi:class I SAM-dependent methyltransferase [Brachyspira hampsonii]|uniref:class I SAM-dependent methyltransferase n=1 Tax=Brachyspira hampsonii TaxID=1287055 RepID=UPI000D3D341E|nr:class I SAM-dependent methyltransferase [Brachyspira hampsonii]PTY40509.1 hypothetical protein DQ06_08015 [Brachyspira hampsonii bv. II]
MLFDRKNRGIYLEGNSLYKLNELKKLHKDKSIFNNYSCLCGANDDIIIASEDRYGIDCNFVICKNCGLVRINPYYKPEFIQTFYSQFYSTIYRGTNQCIKDVFNSKIDSGNVIIEHLKNYTDFNSKKVFEIGCGSGGILKAFKNIGCDVYGVDYGKDYLEFAKNNGIKVVEGDFNMLKEFGKCDILIMNHVLEHLLNPIDLLNKIKILLKDSSLVYIEVPTLETLEYFYEYDIFKYLQNAHIYYFSNSLLEKYVKSAGFDILTSQGNLVLIIRKNNNINNNFFISNNFEYIKNLQYLFSIELFGNKLYKLDDLYFRFNKLDSTISNLLNRLAWWIPVKKWRDNFRNNIFNADQTRPDQTRPDQTRPDHELICQDYIYFYNNSKYKKLQPMHQFYIVA